MGKPYKVKIANVTDINTLQEWYDNLQKYWDELEPQLQPLRQKYHDIYTELTHIESEFAKTDSKLNVVRRKIEALKALEKITMKAWYEVSRDWMPHVYFYPMHETSAGRVRGVQITIHENVKVEYRKGRGYKKTTAAMYDYVVTTLSGAILEKLSRLKGVMLFGEDLETNLEKIRKFAKSSKQYQVRASIINKKAVNVRQVYL